MHEYLQMRDRYWYAVMDVPEDVQGIFKRRQFSQSLKTDSESLALRRASFVVTTWQSRIARARKEPDDDEAFFRRAAARAKTEREQAYLLYCADVIVGKRKIDPTIIE